MGGGAGGLAGAALAHAAVTLVNRGFGGVEHWLKGPYGPPFFDIALYMGILYAGIALGLLRRPKDAALGFAGPFLGVAAPMGVLSRTLPWAAEGSRSNAWYIAVVAVFVAATWGTIAALGASAAPKSRFWGAFGSATGAFFGYLALTALTWAAPALKATVWSPLSLLPAPTALLDGLFSGAGMGLGISLSTRRKK